MKFEISFRDIVCAESEEEAYKDLLQYLAECVKNGDVTAFSVEQQEWRDRQCSPPSLRENIEE